MSIHIGANTGDIAAKNLLPGDPLRAELIAETYFEDVIQYNEVRGMYGYTGTYKGERISVQGSGMGVPSISIYAHELMNEYDVQTLIRVGTCGAMQEDSAIRDVILAQGATTDSQMNKLALNGLDYAPLANSDLHKNAYDIAHDNHVTPHVGNVFTSDVFYRDDAEAFNKLLTQYNISGVEMESTALYTLAAKFNRKALSILTVSDHIITGEQTSAEERQTSFHQMMELALE